jgi:hypothetical protein
MGVEPTGAGSTAAHTVLKTGEATGPHPPPSMMHQPKLVYARYPIPRQVVHPSMTCRCKISTVHFRQERKCFLVWNPRTKGSASIVVRFQYEGREMVPSRDLG